MQLKFTPYNFNGNTAVHKAFLSFMSALSDKSFDLNSASLIYTLHGKLQTKFTLANNILLYLYVNTKCMTAKQMTANNLHMLP